MNPLPANNYYRLKISEISWLNSYSPIIKLNGDKTPILNISILTVPVTGTSFNMEINSTSNEQIKLVMIDETGRPILVRYETLQSGSNHVTILATGLSQGIYFMYGIGNEGKTNIVKLFKQ